MLSWKLKLFLNPLQLAKRLGNKPPTAWNIKWLKHECVSMQFVAELLLSVENSMSRPPHSKLVYFSFIDLQNLWIFSHDLMLNQWVKYDFNDNITFDNWSIFWLRTLSSIQLLALGLLGLTFDGKFSSIFLISLQ